MKKRATPRRTPPVPPVTPASRNLRLDEQRRKQLRAHYAARYRSR